MSCILIVYAAIISQYKPNVVHFINSCNYLSRDTCQYDISIKRTEWRRVAAKKCMLHHSSSNSVTSTPNSTFSCLCSDWI